MPSNATTLAHRVIDEIGNLVFQPPVGGLGRVIQHGPRTIRQIALTFDDGPNSPSTGDVLDVLQAYGVKATFFCVGVNAKLFPELVKRTYTEGHVIGNHSMYHSRKAGLLVKEANHIDDCTKTLRDIIGVTPLLYRAPWGWYAPQELHRLKVRNFSLIGWDVYTYDWQVPPPPGETMAVDVQKIAKSGSIILFHDGIAGIAGAEKPQTVRAVEDTIKLLRADGYAFVTIPQMLGLPAYF